MTSRSLGAVQETLRARAERPPAESGHPFPKIEPLPGSLHAELRRCGKPACRCAGGHLHGPYVYRRWREGGRQRRRYVRPEDLARVKAGLDAWRRLHPADRSAREALRWLREHYPEDWKRRN